MFAIWRDSVKSYHIFSKCLYILLPKNDLTNKQKRMSAPAVIQQQKATPAAAPVVFHAADELNNAQGPKIDFAGYVLKKGDIIKVRCSGLGWSRLLAELITCMFPLVFFS